MNRSEKIEQVSASLFAVHRDLANPRKDAKGQVRGKVNYRYLSLPALIDHLRPKLKEAQLYVTQEVAGGENFVTVYTTVWHLSGQFIEFGPAFMPASGDAQQVGSATSYCRRYALSAVFNLAADEDDDAASANLSRSAGAGESTARTNRGLQTPSDVKSAAAAQAASPQTSGLPPDQEASAGSALGEGAPVGASPYLSPHEQRLLADRLGMGRNDLLRYARTKYGERIRRLDDLTHEMEMEMSP